MTERTRVTGAGAADRKPPRPTTITWCPRCLRAGMRLDKDEIDRRCRYCGGPVTNRRHPTLRRARAALTERWKRRQTAVANGDITELRRGKRRYEVTASWKDR